MSCHQRDPSIVKTIRTSIILAICALGFISPGFAFNRLSAKAEIFQINGRDAFLMKAPQPAQGMPWVWYAPTLKNNPHKSQKFYFDALLKQGISVAGYDLGECRGSEHSSAEFSKFYNALVAKGYSSKPILMGQSRGGLMMLCWAFRNPNKVKAFTGIYPVCNLNSWPMKTGKNFVLKDYQLSEQEFLKRIKEFNPEFNLKVLVQHQIPIFILHGDADKPVPYLDNTARIEKEYKKLGGNIKVKIVPGKGHAEIPEFFEDQDLLGFIKSQID